MGKPEELIRKQDAIKVIDELLIQMIRDGCLTVIGELRVKELKQDIENLPAVQPEPYKGNGDEGDIPEVL